MNSERIAAWYAAMANYIPLWKKGSERLANTRSSHSISYWLVTRLLSTGVITAAYSIHSCYLSCLVIGEYIALHHIVYSSTARCCPAYILALPSADQYLFVCPILVVLRTHGWLMIFTYCSNVRPNTSLRCSVTWFLNALY